MIGKLEGRLSHIRPGEVLVEAGGVGYLVSTTLRAVRELAKSEHTSLWIHTQVRADAIVLFGFPEHQELETFERLIAVAGVGPRTALAVLSALTPAELAEAVENGDTALLERTPGVGRKTAQRLQLELMGRLDLEPGGLPDCRKDAVSALVNLGYKQREARRAVDAVPGDAGSLELGEVLRLALQSLTR